MTEARRVPKDRLEALIAALFAAAGCASDEAGRIAHYLVKANLWGHDSHGVIRVPRYLTLLAAGDVVAGARLRITDETEAWAAADGGHGFGQTIGPEAVGLGIAKAKRSGTAIVALAHSGHLGCIGHWAEMAAEAGLVSIHFVNVAGSLLVAPFGAVERRLSTAPFAVGVPRPGAPPFILDFATSVVAEGKVLVALSGGPPLPEDALIDAAGAPSADPSLFYGPRRPGELPSARGGRAALRAMGGHKGSGLALACELLAGALTGSGCAGPDPQTLANGMLSIYLDPGRFAETFAEECARYLTFVASARPAEEGGRVRLPGEPERARAAERSRLGIPLPAETRRALAKAARERAVDPALIEAALGPS